MSIIEHTTKLDLTQYSGSSVKAQLYANYNSDMQKIDSGYATLDEAINGEEGLGARVSALETSVTTIDEKADNAVSTANDAKTTAEGFDTRVTTLEGKVSDLETWAGGVDTTLEAYDGRLDAIEEVIETVSTANINDLIARMDALEQKVDANTQSIDTLNDNIISAVNRIVDLETGLGTTNANLNVLAGRVTLLEDCCSSVRETLTDHNTRINKNASDISALDARLTRDETNIAGNASDITILATQNNTQAGQIDDLYSKYNALDPSSPTNLYARVNTLEAVVGDTPLQTTAQTVTGAINELLGQTTDVDADEVEYDNTNSGLVASDVQGAIDEVSGNVDVDSARIDALETTVGGAGEGLVKDVADNTSAITDVSNRVTTLEKDTYSTSEVDTGKVWVNGKKIYRKCFNYTNVIASGSNDVIGSISGFEDILDIRGAFRNYNDSNAFPIGYSYRDSNGNFSQCFPVNIGNATGDIIAIAYGFPITKINVMVEYTKTNN